MTPRDWCLLLLGAVAVASALGVVAFRNAVHSALSLTVNLLSVAVCFLLLGSQFLAVSQVLIYAGAIMVLFLFAVTLLAPKEASNLLFGQGPEAWTALVLGVLVAGGLGFMVARSVYSTVGDVDVHGTSADFSSLLLGDYALPFEATAFVLLVAIVGAAILGKATAGDDV